MSDTNKTAVIKFRVTPDEKEEIETIAKSLDMNVSAYMRLLATGNERVRLFIEESETSRGVDTLVINRTPKQEDACWVPPNYYPWDTTGIKNYEYKESGKDDCCK